MLFDLIEMKYLCHFQKYHAYMMLVEVVELNLKSYSKSKSTPNPKVKSVSQGIWLNFLTLAR